MKKNNSVSFLIYIFLVILVVIVAKNFFDGLSNMSQKVYELSDVYRDIREEKVEKIEYRVIDGSNGAAELVVTLKEEEGQEGIGYKVEVPFYEQFAKEIQELTAEHGVLYSAAPIKRRTIFTELFSSFILIAITLGTFFLAMNIIQGGRGGGGGSGNVMNFGKSKAKLSDGDQKKVTFDDVAGLDEEKFELLEIVDFLRKPSKYIDIGARIPKGVLLIGPPGTGKTLLARATAGEAGVPFFTISGSEFVEMFVGVGASRVRSLFEEAKKNMPCIIFIDEIDAVGRRRGAGLGGGHDEREQTLNQLLVEMDGFGVNEGVIVIAATNRHDILDPALLRPGRFDRMVTVGRPDIKGREEILIVHSKGKKLAKDVDLKTLALATSGFTGADLENLLNEAAILAARENSSQITMNDVRSAFIKVGIGTEKRSKVMTEKERNLTAYHETGHAILSEVLEETDPVHIISIIPTGEAGGYTLHAPLEELNYRTKGYMEQRIMVLLGGRGAEELVLKDISTGASSDISRASSIARDMVMRFGMSEELGPILYSSESEEVFIGREMSQGTNYGGSIANKIDEEVKKIIKNAYDEAKRIISEHDDVLHKTVGILLEKERITGEEFRALFPEGVLTKNINQDFLASTTD